MITKLPHTTFSTVRVVSFPSLLGCGRLCVTCGPVCSTALHSVLARLQQRRSAQSGGGDWHGHGWHDDAPPRGIDSERLKSAADFCSWHGVSGPRKVVACPLYHVRHLCTCIRVCVAGGGMWVVVVVVHSARHARRLSRCVGRISVDDRSGEVLVQAVRVHSGLFCCCSIWCLFGSFLLLVLWVIGAAASGWLLLPVVPSLLVA